jgi:hypothetical protein
MPFSRDCCGSLLTSLAMDAWTANSLVLSNVIGVAAETAKDTLLCALRRLIATTFDTRCATCLVFFVHATKWVVILCFAVFFFDARTSSLVRLTNISLFTEATTLAHHDTHFGFVVTGFSTSGAATFKLLVLATDRS